MISFEDCVGCKLVSVPLFYLIGMHMAIRNYTLYRDYTAKGLGKAVSLADKMGMVVVPMICFVGGTLNLYLAMGILKTYK